MRILTKTQYDAICDIVMEQKKMIEELEADIEKRKELEADIEKCKEQVRNLEKSLKESEATIDYLNDIVFRRDNQIRHLIHGTHLDSYLIDFPATTKQPEDKLI